MAHTWPAGRRGLVWASRSRPPRPFGGGSSPWPDESPARRAASLCISPSAGPGKPNSVAPWPDCEPFHSRPDGAVGDRATHRTTEGPANSRHPGPREFPAVYSLTIPRIAVPADGHRDPVRQLKTVRRPPIYPNGAQAISPAVPSLPFCCPHAVHRWIRAKRRIVRVQGQVRDLQGQRLGDPKPSPSLLKPTKAAQTELQVVWRSEASGILS